MAEASWLSSTDPAALLRFLTGHGQGNVWVETGQHAPSPRKLRLWACAICRQAWGGAVCPRCEGRGRFSLSKSAPHTRCPACHGTGRVGGPNDNASCRECGGRKGRIDYRRCESCGGTGCNACDNDGGIEHWRVCGNCSGSGHVNRSRQAVEVAERFADGLATREELMAAVVVAAELFGPETNIPWLRGLPSSACESSLDGSWVGRLVQRATRGGIPPATQASLLRCIAGNPWRPVRMARGITSIGGIIHEGMGGTIVPDSVLSWQGGVIPRLAQTIYDDRRWDELPILADMLEEAGATDEDILQHCRGLARCGTCLTTDGRHTGHCKMCGDPKNIPEGFRFGKVTGWVDRGPTARGDWVVDLILGKG